MLAPLSVVSSPPAHRSPVLVTGAAGFLGRALVTRLHTASFAVRSLDVAPPAAELPVDTVHVGDVTNPATVAAAMEGAVALVIAHMAPNRPGVYDTAALPFDINVKGTAILCEAAAKAGVRRVVLVSSTAIVEGERKAGRVLRRDLPPSPAGLYGLTKQLQEGIVAFHQSAGRFSAVSLRPAYVTDADTLTDKYQRQRPTVNWQFIDRRDVAGAVVAALTVGAHAEGVYYLHGHPDGPRHMETGPTAKDLRWTPEYDFSAWPDDAPVAPNASSR